MERVIRQRLKICRQSWRELIAEMMGTFIIIIFGIGCMAQFHLGQHVKIGFLSINFGWGIGVMIGIYWSFGISGAHLNPAITLAMVVAGRLPARKIPHYWLGQSLGALIAVAVCYGVYYDLINGLEPDKRTIATASIFVTFPADGVSHGTAFGDQFLSTVVLVGSIFALTDKRNCAPSPAVLPICVGLLVVGIGISFGINCGYPLNPVRELMPRIFTMIAGWETLAFRANDYYFWVPIAGQFVGSVVGALLYVLSVEMHYPEMKEDDEKRLISEGNVNEWTEETERIS